MPGDLRSDGGLARWAPRVTPPIGVEILDFEDALRVMRDLTSKMRERFAPASHLLDFEGGADLMVIQAERVVETLRKGLKS